MYSNSLVLIANDINLIDSVLYVNIIPGGDPRNNLFLNSMGSAVKIG